MIDREDVAFLPNTAINVRAYSIEEYAPHYHVDCLELLFVIKGEVSILASYDRFHLKEGDFVVINQGDIHYIKGTGENLVLSLYVDALSYTDRYEYIKYLYFICESFNTNNMQMAYVPQIRRIVADITLEACKKEYDESRINEKMDRLMEILVYKFDLTHYHNGRDIPKNQLERYHRIIKEVEERYGEKLGMEELAQKEFIGKNYVSQFWKKMTNMNFTDYLNSRRSEKAERMLLTSDKSINEISLKCGFSDPKYIYKSFKRWYEETPSEHKKIYERYKKEGTSMEEYTYSQILEKFGKELVYAGMDEENAGLIRSAQISTSWRKKYETQIGKYTGSKIKGEMIRESYQEAGLREIYLPLFDKDTVMVENGEVTFDRAFVTNILKKVKEMNLILLIEIQFSDRSACEWIKIVESFIETLKKGDNKELLSRCRYVVYFSEFEEGVEVKELIDKMTSIAGERNVKMALRFN